MKIKIDIEEIGRTLSLIAMFPEDGQGYELVYSLDTRTFTEAFRIDVANGKVFFNPVSISRIPLNLTIQAQRLIRERYSK